MITDIQKASLLKRIAAGIFDAMLICVCIVGFAWMLTSILDYSSYSTKLADYYTHYEESYGVSLNLSQAEYAELSDAEQQAYNDAVFAFYKDDGVMKTYQLLLNLTLLITTFSILLSFLLMEFIVPLLLKNGQTVGKKIFGIGLVRVDSVQLTPVQLFVRTILGKYTVETMIPVYMIIMIFFQSIGIVGLIVIGRKTYILVKVNALHILEGDLPCLAHSDKLTVHIYG